MVIDQMDKTDGELVSLSITNPQMYRFLIQRYEGKLRAYVFRISNLTREDTEDVIQEVFISVYKNLNAYNPKYKFSTWIYRITHNHTISYIRKIKYRPKTYDLEDNDLGERLASNLNLEESINHQFIKEELIKALNTIDVRYKSAIVLKFVEDKSYEEISEIMRVPIGTVGTFIKRGRKVLEQKLSKQL